MSSHLTSDSNSGIKESLTPKSFKIEAILGKGAFGEVYLATLKRTGEQFAMKVLSKREIMA
jgi:serine/threonine protein kinase